MYIVRDAQKTFAFDFFFFFTVIFGAFFVLNLMIAVQFTHLGAAFDEEDKRQKKLQDKIKKKAKMRLENEMEDSFFIEDDGESKHSAGGTTPRKTSVKKKGCCDMNDYPTIQSASNKIEKLVEHEYFTQLIIIFILINTLFLALEFYEMPENLILAGNIANVVFTTIFFLEMVLKMFGLGFKKYFSDGFNIFDSIIVCLSLLDAFLASENSGVSVLRAFRLMRIFKIIKSWTSLRILLSTVLRSISAITNLGFLTMLYLFISALLAKQFFQNPLFDSDGEPSRYSFSSTGFSLITIFIVLTGENWNEVMVQVIASEGNISSPAIFFICLMIIGNYMLLNLFLAILLKFISENESDNDDEGVAAPGSSVRAIEGESTGKPSEKSPAV